MLRLDGPPHPDSHSIRRNLLPPLDPLYWTSKVPVDPVPGKFQLTPYQHLHKFASPKLKDDAEELQALYFGARTAKKSQATGFVLDDGEEHASAPVAAPPKEVELVEGTLFNAPKVPLVKLEEREKLKWGQLPKRQIEDDETRAQLMAIRLRGQMDPKAFYKSNDSDKLPERFSFGTMQTARSGLRVGEGTALNEGFGKNSRKNTVLGTGLRDEGVREWVFKKNQEVGERSARISRTRPDASKKKKVKGVGAQVKRSWKKKR